MFFLDSQFTTKPESTDYYRKQYENMPGVIIRENDDGTITVISTGN